MDESIARAIQTALLSLVLLAILSGFFYCVRLVRRMLAMDAHAAMKKDMRRPIVFLRSFADDDAGWDGEIGGREEEQVVPVFKRFGPVVALQDPSKLLADNPGAARLAVKGDWRDELRELLVDSQCVLIRIGTTEGLLYEIYVATAILDPRQLLLFLPSDDKTRKQEWVEFRRAAERYFPQGLLESITDDAVFVRFGMDWKPHVVTKREYQRKARTGFLGRKRIRVTCSNCSKSLRIPCGRKGRVRCPGCHQLLDANTTVWGEYWKSDD